MLLLMTSHNSILKYHHLPTGSMSGMAATKHIDGSMLEGGGQILRNASALAAITGAPLTVERIRAKRTKPGLQPQHLTSLQLVESMCGGTLQGGQVGSTSITLRPGQLRCGDFSADTKTAGSCTLMLQASMPVCVFGPAATGAVNPSRAAGRIQVGGGAGGGGGALHGDGRTSLELKGGTDADMAPPVGYLTDVLVPLLRNLYGDLMEGLDVRLVRRGFYPRGGGVVTATVPSLPPGTPLPPIDLTTRGNPTQVTIKAFSAGRVHGSVAKRLAAAAEASIRRALKGLGPAGRGVPILTEAVHEPPDRAVGDGCGVLIFADTDTGCRLGASAKGERGVPAEDIGERAAAELGEALTCGTCVDQWMQDQLVIWMALGSGTSRMRCSEPSLHTRTAMVVAEQLLPGVKFTLHRPAGHERTAPGGDGGGGGGGGSTAGATREVIDGVEPHNTEGPYAGSGLWLVECTGVGWTVGKRLDGCQDG